MRTRIASERFVTPRLPAGIVTDTLDTDTIAGSGSSDCTALTAMITITATANAATA